MKTNHLILSFLMMFSIYVNAQEPGTLNTKFSQDGWDASILGNNNGFFINKTLIQPDGKILVCARAYLQNEEQQAVIARYNLDGTIDTTFGGGDGMVRSKEDVAINRHTSADGMALQNNGKIIVAGDVSSKTERIICLNADGSLDTTFGTAGVVDIHRKNSAFIHHVAIQSDNKIIVCGKERRLVNNVLEPFVFLWRFTEKGLLDTSFGNTGMISYNATTWPGNVDILLSINDLILLPDDSILINQSYTVSTNSYVMLRKFDANGVSDASFGINGEAIKYESTNGGNLSYSSSAIQQNGSIVTSFTSQDENKNYTQSIYRINANGETDESFNIRFKNPTCIPNIAQVITTGEKLYLIKKANPAGLSHDEIHCFDLEGKPVTTFGKNGIALLNQNNMSTSYDVHAAVSSNGTIYLVSDSSNSNLGQFILVSSVIGFDSKLSLNTELTTSEITISPNPTTGIATISLQEHTKIDKIEIVDILGKIVWEESENSSQIDLNKFSCGTYSIKIYSGENIILKKIIKK